MKRVFFVSMILCMIIMAGCRDEKTPVDPVDPSAVPVEPVQPAVPPTPMKAGMLIFNDINVVKKDISAKDMFPIAY